MSDTKVTINKLNNTNYQIWKFKVEMYLSDKEVWDAVSSERPAEATAQAAWDKKDRSARAKISLLVEDDQLIHIRNKETAGNMWAALQQVHERSNLNSKLFLFRKLYGMRFDGSLSMQDHIRSMLEIIDRIRGLGEEMKETNIVAIMLCSLPDDYDSLITALEARPDAELTLEYVKGKLMDAYERRQDKFEAMNSNKAAALKTSSSYGKEKAARPNPSKFGTSKETRSCFHCGKPGHVKRNCFKLKADGGRDQAQDHKAKSAVGISEGELSNEEQFLPVCFKTAPNCEVQGWFVDSGASKHMTNNRNFFESLTEEKQNTVKIADGTCIQVSGVGHGYLYCQLNEGATRKIEVKDVLFVPALDGSLLSVRCLTDKGFKVKFENTECKIYNGNEVVAKAYRNDHLYKLACVESARKAEVCAHDNCIHAWHRRFGHRHPEAIQKLKSKDLVDGLTISTCSERMQCTCCIKAKMTKQPFPKKSTTRATRPGELIHSDICGPMKTTTPGGNRYILTLIDDYSRYLTVHLLKCKNETDGKIREFVAHLKNKFGRAPGTFRTDGGGEYVNKELQAYFQKEGIHHELTVSYSPEQNGVAERRNRYLTEMARCMLLDADLENLYWGEAVSTAAFLQNRLPTSASEFTPYELWHGRKANVEHLRTFGCKAFYLVPQEKRSKLDDRGKEAVLLGYSAQSKGYRLLDKVCKKIVIARSVTFVESKEMFIRDSPSSLTPISDSEVEVDETTDVPNEVDPPRRDTEQRRSSRANRGVPPERFICAYKTVFESPTEPTTWQELNSLPDKEKKLWLKATDAEMKALEEKDVWKLETLPRGKKAIDCKWVFKVKQNKEGDVQRYKARLVARGFTQKPGEDFHDTYAPVAASSTLRTLLMVASNRKLKVVHFDVETAFLNGEIEEELYMNQPEGYIKTGFEDKVLKLKKGLYGLKQGAKAWNDKINEVLVGHGYRRSETDRCLYSKNVAGLWVYLLLYVDDVIVCVPNSAEEEKVMKMLNEIFESKNLGEVALYLGIQIERTEEGCFLLHQSSKIRQLLSKYGMEDAKPVSTPMLPEYLKDGENSKPHQNITQYREAVGALLYLSTTTRPDIATAVGILCRKVSCPTSRDWEAVKRIMKYLKKTVNLALKLGSDNGAEFYGYVDSDWGGDSHDRKSTSGYLFRLGESTIMWSSRKQSTVALSSSEAEYIAMSNSCRELLWLMRLLNDFNVEVKTPVLINEDNQGCIKMIEGEKINQRCRHIDIKYHHVRDLNSKRIIRLNYCPTEEMLADLFTKPLGNSRFKELCNKIGLLDV